MHRLVAGRRVVMMAAAVPLLLAGLVPGASGAAAAQPDPIGSLLSQVLPPAAPEPPPIALRPPGSSSSGSLVGIRADSGARVVAQKWLSLRMVDLTIYSPAVGANVVTRVIVPGWWSQKAKRTWPLVVMLHGANDDYTSWTRETAIAKISAGWDVLVAMPDAGRAAPYVNMFNGGKGGPPRWETFHTVELLQILQRGMRAGTSRAVAGLSAGGYGAMTYAARHRGMFRYAASFSGTLNIRQSPTREALLAENATTGDPTARWGVPLLDEANWAAHDPYTLAANLRGMSLYLSSGYTGLPSAGETVPWTPLQFGEVLFGQSTVVMSARLTALGIPHTQNLYALGQHDWVAWDRDLARSWPQMMKAIGGNAF